MYIYIHIYVYSYIYTYIYIYIYSKNQINREKCFYHSYHYLSKVQDSLQIGTHTYVIWFEHPWIPSHWRTNFSSLKKKNNLFIRLRPTASYLSGKHSVHSHTCASKHVCWLASVYCVPAIFQVWCQGWWRKQDMILGLKELTDTFNLVKALSNLLCSIGFPCQALKTFSVNHWS